MRAYAVSLVLLAWAGLWAVGLQGDVVVVGGLAATAGGSFVTVRELVRRYRG